MASKRGFSRRPNQPAKNSLARAADEEEKEREREGQMRTKGTVRSLKSSPSNKKRRRCHQKYKVGNHCYVA